MERRFVLKENGLQIPCVLEEPEYCTVRRCIIGVHGFCGSKDSKILVDIAEEMGLFGAATLRFDFPAHGDSPVTDWELSRSNVRILWKRWFAGQSRHIPGWIWVFLPRASVRL